MQTICLIIAAAWLARAISKEVESVRHQKETEAILAGVYNA